MTKRKNKIKRASDKRLTISQAVELLRTDLTNFKIRHSQRVINDEKLLAEVRNETVSFSKIIGAMLDLTADINNIPQGVLTDRFLFYCQEREIVSPEGNVKGDLIISKYNF